jgi:hypothetical protein
MAQYLALRHAPQLGSVRGSCPVLLGALAAHGALDAATAASLLAAHRQLAALFHTLRLCAPEQFDEHAALPGLRKILAKAMGAEHFDAARARLLALEAEVLTHYTALLTPETGATP